MMRGNERRHISVSYNLLTTCACEYIEKGRVCFASDSLFALTYQWFTSALVQPTPLPLSPF